MKPLVNIQDCYIFLDYYGKQKLSGIVENYPQDPLEYPSDLENGHRVYTSRIVKISEDKQTVETERNIYTVKNWVPGPHDKNTKT